MDAARLSPFLAVFLFCAPVLWPSGTQTMWAMLYLFGAWCVLIVVMAVIAPALTQAPLPPPDRDREDSEAP